METGISIGGPQLDVVGLAAAGATVEQVLRAGHESHADQETVRAALDALGRMASVTTTIQDTTVDARSIHADFEGGD